MTKQTPKTKSRAKVASHTPGRLRFKLHTLSRDPDTLEGIVENLQTREGIHTVRLNRDCGSVTVHYDKERHSMAGILGFLEDIDVLVESIAHVPGAGEGVEAAAGGHAPGFITAINDLNERLRQVSGLPVDLKLVLPLAFVGAGVWSVGKRGLMIESMPGWLFFWFAFDMFVKLHPVGRRGSEEHF
jgi:hypothetical protein